MAAISLSGCSSNLDIAPPSDYYSYNCKAYAFGEINASNPGGTLYERGTEYTAQEIYDLLSAEYGNQIRQVDEIDGELKYNEYLVALKDGSGMVSMDDPSTFVIDTYHLYDYHFSVQNSKTGIWSDKPGRTPLK